MRLLEEKLRQSENTANYWQNSDRAEQARSNRLEAAVLALLRARDPDEFEKASDAAELLLPSGDSTDELEIPLKGAPDVI